jgi:glycosyltransferase involved in cell wall biosynthesis
LPEVKKRVLIAVDWFPPAFKAGGPIRSAYNLAAFLSQTHEVWVVTGNRDLGEEQPLDVRADQWSTVEMGTAAIQVRYTSRIDKSQWKDILDEVKPEVIHLNSLFSKGFTLLPLRVLRQRPNVRVVMAPRGMLGEAALSIKPLKKRMFLALARGMGWMDRVRWHASSEQEATEVRQAFPHAQTAVAQNLPSPAPSEIASRPDDRWNIAVIGRIHRVKNLHFGLQAVLGAQSSRPVTVNFIGPVEDAAYKLELERLATKNSAVEVVFHGGMPPSELGPHFQAAHYLLSSTTQENFGHSIVEAWAHGCPVLISDRTPWRGLEAYNVGWDWPLDESEWNAGLNAALTLNDAEWEAKSRAARGYFSERVQSAEAERANLALFDL